VIHAISPGVPNEADGWGLPDMQYLRFPVRDGLENEHHCNLTLNNLSCFHRQRRTGTEAEAVLDFRRWFYNYVYL